MSQCCSIFMLMSRFSVFLGSHISVCVLLCDYMTILILTEIQQINLLLLPLLFEALFVLASL